MRKIVVFGAIMMMIILMWPTEAVSQADDFQVIPDDAIRLRILANSDHSEDQEVKELVRDEVSEQISSWVEHITDINEARNLIEERIPELEELISNVLKEEGIKQPFDIEYNDNVTFPAKLYDTLVYPPGEYEAVLITIGEGKGSNWWCVLFPPLCFLDFGDGATVADGDDRQEDEKQEEKDEGVKVKFFLFEWFGWT